MDKDARLVAARRKLKQFKRKKASLQKKSHENDGKGFMSETSIVHAADKDDTEIQRSEEFIDEKFELLHCTEDDILSTSTAATTENILQVSAKLIDIAAEADMFIDDGSVESNEESFQNVELPESYHNKMITLEIRNQELASTLSSSNQENEKLNIRCQHLTEQLRVLQQEIIEDKKNKNEGEILSEQLQVQMQTIGVLVSEKQDMHQELLGLQSKLENSDLQQIKSQEIMSAMKNKLDLFERDMQSKIDTLNQLKECNNDLQFECDSYKQKFIDTINVLANEQIQSTEQAGKLQMQEMELQKLHASFSDAQEKLEMAEVLLQQMPANESVDTTSQQEQLQQENETLSTKLHDYQYAFEQLNSEREQLVIRHADTQREWEENLNKLQVKVLSLESEKQELSEVNFQIPSTVVDNVATTSDGNVEDLRTHLEDSAKTNMFLRQEIEAQQNNNQHLSRLLQEKESRLFQLENDLENVKTAVTEHENLLDNARDDKLTISRALLQNRQLKEQLEEIQEGFIRLSNDKMDLATQVSSLEHSNKDLQTCLDNNLPLHQQTMELELDNNVMKIHSLENEKANLKSQIMELQYHTLNGNDEYEIEKLSQHRLGDHVLGLEFQSEKKTFEDSLCDEQVTVIAEVNDNPNENMNNTMVQLREKFTKVMKEKAVLLNDLELLEHTNTQLQNECDTIGEYIALYHNQRQILKQRHGEKDKYISTIIREREAMHSKVEHLQTLILAMLNSNQVKESNVAFLPSTQPNLFTSDGPNMSISSDKVNDSPNKFTRLNGRPDLVPKSDILVMGPGEIQLSESEIISPVTSKMAECTSSFAEQSDTAAAQILTILQQMQKPMDTALLNETAKPTAFCMRYIGPYTAI